MRQQVPVELTVLREHQQEAETEKQLHRLVLHDACLGFTA